MFRVPERPELKGREIVLQTPQPDLEREVGGEEGDSLAPPKPGDGRLELRVSHSFLLSCKFNLTMFSADTGSESSPLCRWGTGSGQGRPRSQWVHDVAGTRCQRPFCYTLHRKRATHRCPRLPSSPRSQVASVGREGRLLHHFPHALTWAHPGWGQLMGEAEGPKRESPGGRRQALLWTVALEGLSLLVPSPHLHQPQVTVEDSDVSGKGHLEMDSE